ncbi:MAG: hypothetical protein RLZZ141_740 [Pseudomonadota bacterium]|jgi:hypothetical protein
MASGWILFRSASFEGYLEIEHFGETVTSTRDPSRANSCMGLEASVSGGLINPTNGSDETNDQFGNFENTQ